MKRKVLKSAYKCQRGPCAGYTFYLEKGIGGITLVFTYKGETGYYSGGVWRPVELPKREAIEHLFVRRLETI